MRNLKTYLENRNIEYDLLLNYGFILKNDHYIFEKSILKNHFKIIVEISSKKATSKIIDLETNEEYILVDLKETYGEFVGKLKEKYENILEDIIKSCTTLNTFKNKQSKQIIKYIKEKYKDDLEYLWEKFPNNAIVRNKNSKKWYGVLLVLSETKLGLESNKIVEVINLRYQKEKIKEIIDKKTFFKGYHMNKNNWITIKLDESVDIKTIYQLIDNSYQLSL